MDFRYRQDYARHFISSITLTDEPEEEKVEPEERGTSDDVLPMIISRLVAAAPDGRFEKLTDDAFFKEAFLNTLTLTDLFGEGFNERPTVALEEARNGLVNAIDNLRFDVTRDRSTYAQRILKRDQLSTLSSIKSMAVEKTEDDDFF